MTVLYIIDSVQGGASLSFLEMVSNLQMQGVTPIVCTRNKDDYSKSLESRNIKVIAVGHTPVLAPVNLKQYSQYYFYFRFIVSYFYRRNKSLKTLIENIDISKIDLIHTNSARSDLGCFLSKRYSIPHICHIREFADKDFGCKPMNPFYIRNFNLYTNRFVAISNAIKSHWVNKGLLANKIKVIYNGINYSDISLSTDRDKAKKVLKIAMVGGVVRTKGQHLVLEALSLLPESVRVNIKVDIIGWGDQTYINYLKKTTVEKGLEDNVSFLGARKDVHELLGKYQIGMMCSFSEGFGRATAEYMHACLGVIASNSGANPELITDKKEGLLFKSEDAKSLSDCILTYYNDRELLAKCSKRGREKAIENYTASCNGENIYKLYQQVLDNKNEKSSVNNQYPYI